MESATQTLHRLTSLASFELGREWEVPADDPRVLRDLVVNDLSRFPWFFRRYPQALPRVPLPRSLPATTARLWWCSRGRRTLPTAIRTVTPRNDIL